MPSPPPPTPRPGWTTTEFWTTTMVHVAGAVATVLILTGHSDDGLQAVEAAIPIAALAISAVVNIGYSRARTRVKLDRAAAFCGGVAGDLARILPVLERDARLAEPLAEVLDPAAMARLKAASDAWHGVTEQRSA